MTKQSSKHQGDELELEVANIYRQLGVKKIKHNYNLGGNQIDVYIEMECADGAIHRMAIEAKNLTSRPVGIAIVNKFATVIRNLKSINKIDAGVIVSRSGFSREAKQAMEEHGLRLLELADLRARLDQTPSQANVTYITSTFISNFEAKVTTLKEEAAHFMGKPIPEWYLKFAGMIGGAIIGAGSGIMLGWIFGGTVPLDATVITSALFGGIIGSILGWVYWLTTWFILLGIISIIHIGAIIGGAIGVIATSGLISSSSDGLIAGAMTGAIVSLLVRLRALEAIKEQFGSSIIRELVRTILSLISGIVLGSITGLFIAQAVIQELAYFENVIIGMVFGIILGASLSIVIITSIFLFLMFFLFEKTGKVLRRR